VPFAHPYDERVTTPPPAYGPPPGPDGQQPAPYGAPPPASPYGYAVPPPPGKRPVRTWDLVVTILLLVLDGVLAAIMSFFGFFLAMAGDSCGARDCNSDLIAVGLMVAVALPWLLLIIVAVVSIVLLVKRRIAFWVPLIGAVLIIASWFVGAVIASAGVPGAL
jgi:uncharacterized BrkB/YihY/UPF0761 family membrane protein